MPAWYEMAGSPKERLSRGGFGATRKILTAWSDRITVAESLVGVASTTGLLNSLQYPGSPSVRCVSVDIEPLTDDVTAQTLTNLNSDLNAYDSYAVLTARYESVQTVDPDLPDPEDGTYFSYRLDVGAEGLIFGGTQLHWASAGSDVLPLERDMRFNKIVSIQEHHLTWHRVLRPPKNTFRDIAGHVNTDTYLGASPGTLLFLGATMEREWAFDGELEDSRPAYRVNLVFKEKRIDDNGTARGWNYAYRSLPVEDKGWKEIELSDGQPPYPSKTFSRLTQVTDPGE